MEANSKQAADVRAASVARLKRAASLPRMKDGRRPAVNGTDGDSHDTNTSGTPSASAATTPFTTSGDLPSMMSETVDSTVEESSKGAKASNSNPLTHEERQDPPITDQPETEGLTTMEHDTATPSVLTRGRRRRSRSRGSRSGTPKLEIPPSTTTNVITPIQRPSTPAAVLSSPSIRVNVINTLADLDAITPQKQTLDSEESTNLSPSQPRNRTFATPISPFHPQMSPFFANPHSPFSPIGASGPLTLEQLQSNYAAGGLSRSVSVGRAHALHKLTGGNLSPSDSDLFPPFGSSGPRAVEKPGLDPVASPIASNAENGDATNTPPPAGNIARSNTVAGGERVAARAAMLQQLRRRVGPTAPVRAASPLGLSERRDDLVDHANVLVLKPPVDDTVHSTTVAGVSYDEGVPNSGTEEVLVMPEIVARENKRKRRRHSRRSSSTTNALASLTNVSEENAHNDYHDDSMTTDDRRFDSEGNTASRATTPASQFSPPTTFMHLQPAPVSGFSSPNHILRGTPSPRPSAFTPPPRAPLFNMIGTYPVPGTPPNLPEGPRRIEQLDDVDLRRQEELQARYYQGINLLRAASGGSGTGSGNIRVLIEEEDEPLPLPVMEPTSPSHPDVPDNFSIGSPSSVARPSVDSLEAHRRPKHHSGSPSLLSSTDGQSSPGFGNIVMTRVPLVMHQYGADGQPAGFGRKGRTKASGIEESTDGEHEGGPLVNIEPFPQSVVFTPGHEPPIQYTEYASEDEADHEREEKPDGLSPGVVGGRLAPSPRAWNPKSSASWIVDSYFRDEEDNDVSEDIAALESLQQGTFTEYPPEDEQTTAPPVPPKDDWDVVLPQTHTLPPSRVSPSPKRLSRPNRQSGVATPSNEGDTTITLTVPPSNADTKPTSETPSSPVIIVNEDGERLSGVTSSDVLDKASSSSGLLTGSQQRIGLSASMRSTAESQDSFRLGLGGISPDIAELDDDGSSERKTGQEKLSGWAKVKHTLIRRRSRSNSLARDRSEKGESAISRESAGSIKEQQGQQQSGEDAVQQVAANGSMGLPTAPFAAANFAASSSNLLSVTSIPRGVSPLPPPSPGDFARYNDPKLTPFPGLYQLEEQRNNRKMAANYSLGSSADLTQQNAFPGASLNPNPAALSAPLPASTRHSPDEGSEPNGGGLMRKPSFGQVRQQDRAWPLPQEDYFEPAGSVSRSGSTGSNVKKWLKVLQPGSSPSPSPHPYPPGYSPALGSAPLERSTPTPSNLMQKRPSLADILAPTSLQRRPSTPNILQGLSRKSSLADGNGPNGHGLKSTASKSSLKKAFGLFGGEPTVKDSAPINEQESTKLVPSPQDPGVTTVQADKTEDMFGMPTPASLPDPLPSAPHMPTETEVLRPTSPAPLALPPPSPVPIPLISPQVEPNTRPTNTPSISRIRSPPPMTSRPQSPFSRAQSPSILKKEPAYRAQSPPIRTQSPGYESPRARSPFLVHSPSLIRSKGSNTNLLKTLSSAEIISRVDSMLVRNSSGSVIEQRPKIIEDPPRKLLLVTPVLQVISKDSVKDRTLFLFSDVLIVAKCMTNIETGLVMDKLFTIKTVIELRRCSGPILSVGSPGLCSDRRSPFLQSFVETFKTNQSKAISTLCEATGVKNDDYPFIADVLFRTHELDRAQLGDYLARRNNREILHAFVDKFNFSGIRIDFALRIFLLSILLSDGAEQRSLENLLHGFATQWFSANSSTIGFERECAARLVVSIVLLNASIHMTQTHHQAPATAQDFYQAVRAYDTRHSIKEDLLEDIYEAVKQEKISAPKETPGETRGLSVTIIGATSPMHFIHRVKSDVVRVRLPAADPNFRIHLLGQGLLFEPPTLHFSNSPEATFRVTGTTLGKKSIVYWRAGANAHLYSTMPLVSEIVIERPFMRNTLRLDLTIPGTAGDRESISGSERSLTHTSKKSYVFSIEDPREYDHWAKILKMRIDRAAHGIEPERPPTAQGSSFNIPANPVAVVPPRIRRAAEMVAFEVLKDTLLANQSFSSATSSPPETHISKIPLSASFSKASFSQEASAVNTGNEKEHGKVKRGLNGTDVIRDGHEIATLCVQNSLIPALISALCVGHESVDNSQIGSGIGRPQTPKAVNVVRQ